jgi:hypothetical protein
MMGWRRLAHVLGTLHAGMAAWTASPEQRFLRPPALQPPGVKEYDGDKNRY